MKIAYIRTSSVQQNLDVQRETVTKFGVDKIFEEQVSGASTDNREQLKQALDFVRDGDELVVTRIDRLARSVRDLQNIVHELEQKNVKLVCTEQPVDTSNAMGKMFLDLLGVFASFERTMIKERQAEGIAKAKLRGVYKGRKPKVEASRINDLKEEGLSISAIAREGVSQAKYGRLMMYFGLVVMFIVLSGWNSMIEPMTLNG